jgi:hypothetical protein
LFCPWENHNVHGERLKESNLYSFTFLCTVTPVSNTHHKYVSLLLSYNIILHWSSSLKLSYENESRMPSISISSYLPVANIVGRDSFSMLPIRFSIHVLFNFKTKYWRIDLPSRNRSHWVLPRIYIEQIWQRNHQPESFLKATFPDDILKC